MKEFYNLFKFLLEKKDAQKIHYAIVLFSDFVGTNSVKEDEDWEWFVKVIELEDEWINREEKRG